MSTADLDSLLEYLSQRLNANIIFSLNTKFAREEFSPIPVCAYRLLNSHPAEKQSVFKAMYCHLYSYDCTLPRP